MSLLGFECCFFFFLYLAIQRSRSYDLKDLTVVMAGKSKKKGVNQTTDYNHF